MATGTGPGGGSGPPPPSYANRVKQNMLKIKSLERNVLDITIEKNDQHQIVNLSGEEVERVCQLIGMRCGAETEGYQVQYRGKYITVSVWAKPRIGLERFNSEGPIVFSEDLMITSVRPAASKEVMVLFTGLPFNTPDEMVKEYLECFGAKLKTGVPTLGRYTGGPWKGQYNGERRYRADFSNQVVPMGTYHLLGGTRVRVLYNGNTNTCARCHKAPTQCMGGGKAKVCGDKGGPRVNLKDHMLHLWRRVGYVSGDTSGDTEEYDDEDPVFNTGGTAGSMSAQTPPAPPSGEVREHSQLAAPVSQGNIGGEAIGGASQVQTEEARSSAVINTEEHFEDDDDWISLIETHETNEEDDHPRVAENNPGTDGGETEHATDTERSLEERLTANVRSIPGMTITEEETKVTLEMMRKAEKLAKDKEEVREPCVVCGKTMLRKSIRKHMRDKHSHSGPSVSSLASAIDQQVKVEKENQGKRKPEDFLSPPTSQPDRKKSIPSEDPPEQIAESGSPTLRVGPGSGSGDIGPSLKTGTGGN